jgi:hypothetical protein
VNVSQVNEKAREWLGSDVEAEKVNGVCRIVRPLRESEKAEEFPGRITKAGKLVLGVGPGWLSALRFAMRPELARRKAEEQRETLEIQKERAGFQDWLLSQYEAWKASKDAPPPS